MQHEPSQDMDITPGASSPRDLLVAYALGIASSDEAREVEALLAQDPALASDIDAYRQMSEAVLLATPPLQPPDAALDRLMAAIALPAQPGGWQRFRDGLFSARWRVSPALVAAVLAIFIGVVGYLSAQVNTLRQTHLQTVSSVQAQNVALTLMRSRDVRWVKMQSPLQVEAPETPFAWLVYSPGEQAGVILASQFPAPADDMTYQLWANENGEPVDLGVLEVDPSGVGWTTFYLPDTIVHYNRLGITLEPAGGSPTPTSPPLVRLDLSQLDADEWDA